MLIVAAIFLPIEQILYGIQDWSRQAGPTAYVALTLLFAFWVTFSLPTSPYMLLAGFLFGLVKGLAVIWVGGMIGSALGFLLARTMARDWIERRLKRRSFFIALDRAIGRRGLLVVTLTRMVMVIPYPLLNYALGLTKVRFRDYFIGTNVGMVLPFALFVFLGTTASDVTAIMRGDVHFGRNEWIVASVVFVAVVGLIFLTLRVAGKTLREELLAAEQETG
jgi:uncharacterized membrane protein YdjX (TVP38/TMEM64 family)